MEVRHLTIVRVLKVWFEITLGASMVAGAGLVVWLALSPLVMTADQPADSAVRVSLGTGMLRPVLPVDIQTSPEGDVSSLRIVEGRGELRFQTRSWSLQFLLNAGLLLTIALVIVSVWLLRLVLKSVLEGEPFAAANARRLRLMGLLILAGSLVLPILEYAGGAVVLSRVALEGIELSPLFDLSKDRILGGLLILVLATVFDRGARLEQDQSLTI
jgi:hypothetical protein